MLTNLQQQPADALLALIKLHNADPRADKIDLGVGVYRTDTGATPVFASIKAAERVLLETQDSKAYLGPEGDMGFVHALMPYVFGKEDPTLRGRIEGMQTPGGTGAVRLALALAKRAGVKRIWMGTPSWPNHAQIVADLGLELKTFVHATKAGIVDMDSLRFALNQVEAEDAILLHGCCHNPTGIDYSNEQWDEIAPLLAKAGVLPILDLAYQGLGAGMEEDAYGTRKVLGLVPEALVAYSCDKNFGLYRDRVDADQRPCAGAGRLVDAAGPWRGGGADRSGRPGPGQAVARRTGHDARAHAAGPRAAGRRRYGGQRRSRAAGPAERAVLHRAADG
jgi:aromatic-amino-acid transaminase